jgi:hypothetical protein
MQIVWPKATRKMILVAAVACVIIQIPFGWRAVSARSGRVGVGVSRLRRHATAEASIARDCIRIIRINECGTRRRTDLLMCTSNCWSFHLIIYVYVTFHVNTHNHSDSNSFPNHAALWLVNACVLCAANLFMCFA